MKFITKILLLTFIFFSSARAEWVPYANNSDRSMFLYYETLSVKKNNNVFSIQILKNFVEPKKVVLEGNTIVYKSVTDKQLIDCSKNLYRNTEIIFFEEWNANGKELYKSIIDKVKWYEIKSNSVQEGLMAKVCFSV
jgi:hypothetical protein